MRNSYWLLATLVAIFAGSGGIAQPPAEQKKAPTQPPAKSKGSGRRYLIPGAAGGANTPPAAAPRPTSIVDPNAVKPLLQPLTPAPKLNLPIKTKTGAVPVAPSITNRLVSRSSLFGMNVIWGENGTDLAWDKDGGIRSRKLLELMKVGGVTVIRLRVHWAEIERTKGKIEFAELDRRALFLMNGGFPIVGVVDQAPAWVTAPRDQAAQRLFLEEMARFSTAVAIRYKGIINQWEFWPEPDVNGGPALPKDSVASSKPADLAVSYFECYKVFAKSVKAVDPASQVAVGGLRNPGTDFLQSLYAEAGKGQLDAVALKLEPSGSGIALDRVDACRKLMAQNGDEKRPIWISEWAVHPVTTDRNDLEDTEMARRVRDVISELKKRPGVSMAFYRSLTDYRATEGRPDSLVTGGLVSITLVPRPAYRMFRELATGISSMVKTPKAPRVLGSLPKGVAAGKLKPVILTISADKPGAPLDRNWEGFSQGSGPGGALVAGLGSRLKSVQARLFRFDPFPDNEAVKLDGDKFAIDWSYPDAVMKALEEAGTRAIFNLATMPLALSSPTGNAKLPRDSAIWARLLTELVARYKGRVAYWELSNEPDQTGFRLDEWLLLYETFAKTVVGADPAAHVGGPGLSNLNAEWLTALLERCAKGPLPLHFLSWHAYDLSVAEYVRQVREVKGLVAKYPGLKGVELLLSEWNFSSRLAPEHDGLFAASHALTVLESLMGKGVTPLFQQFRDMGGGSTGGFTGRQGALSADGRPKAVFNALQLATRLGGKRLRAEVSDSGVHVIASRSADKITVLVWSYDPAGRNRVPVSMPVRLLMKGLPWKSGTRADLSVVDQFYGNLQSNPLQAILSHAASYDAQPGDMEIGFSLATNAVACFELRALTAPRIEVTCSAKSYEIFGNDVVTISAKIRNVGSKTQTVTPMLVASDVAWLKEPIKSSPITIEPGETRTVPFKLTAPNSGYNALRYLEVSAGDGADSVALNMLSPLEFAVQPVRIDLPGPAIATSRPGEAPPVQIQVSATNRGQSVANVEMFFGKSSVKGTVAAQKTTGFPFRLDAPRLPGNLVAPVRAESDGRTLWESTVQIGVPAIARLASRKPKIDGDLSDWTEAYVLPIDAMVTGSAKRWKSPSDLSGQAMAMWDNDNLYLAVVATDDVHYQPYAPEEMLKADSVHFAIDVKRGERAPSQAFDDGIREFGMALYRNQGALYRFLGMPGTRAGLVDKVQLVVKRAGARTIYELAIPWSEFMTGKPKLDQLFGFTILLNDSDGEKAVSTFEWASGLSRSRRADQFVGMRLINK